ncbi:MAG: hypothetical protein M0014_07915 [Actinomycetota bacterium]|jgi:hypothetical protein|nr:hypothetical protein [Actinomycetota bacterium]
MSVALYCTPSPLPGAMANKALDSAHLARGQAAKSHQMLILEKIGGSQGRSGRARQAAATALWRLSP